MRILTALADRAGCGLYRLLLPLGELKRRGHDVVWSGEYDVRTFDIVVAQRSSNVEAHSQWVELASHKDRSYRLIQEIDDPLWLVEKSNPMAYQYYGQDKERLRRLRECIEAADMVTTTTEPLARMLRAMTNAPVVVIGNYVDKPIFRVERKPTDHYTLGFAGSYSHSGDWAAEGRGIGRYLARHPEVGMHFIGTDLSAHLPGSALSQVRVTPWLPDIHAYYAALEMDVRLIPLKDTPFNRGKSALAAVEAMSLGIVPVASASLAYNDVIDNGKTGFLCSTDKEWQHALSALEDPDLRSKMAARGREKARAWTVQRNAYKWTDAYQAALASL